MNANLRYAKPPKPLYNLLEDMRDNLESYGVTSRWSKRGVPHLVVTNIINPVNGTYSIAYFGKTKIYRIFSPYPSYGQPQTKQDFLSIEEVIKFFRGF